MANGPTHAPRSGNVRGVTDAAEILITGGTIVDGTGAPGRAGSVVVDGERLRLLEPNGP